MGIRILVLSSNRGFIIKPLLLNLIFKNYIILFLIYLSEDIYSIYHMYIARDLRETRMYYRRCTRERKNKNYPLTNTAYVLQYSDTHVR